MLRLTIFSDHLLSSIFSLQKENDNLNISKTEVEVYLSYMNGSQTAKIYFSVQNITEKPDRSTILCKFKREGTEKIDFSTVKVFVSRISLYAI